jgi:hypothetical protein
MSETVRQFNVKADDDGVRLDRWFKRHLPEVSFAMISRWARTESTASAPIRPTASSPGRPCASRRAPLPSAKDLCLART